VSTVSPAIPRGKAGLDLANDLPFTRAGRGSASDRGRRRVQRHVRQDPGRSEVRDGPRGRGGRPSSHRPAVENSRRASRADDESRDAVTRSQARGRQKRRAPSPQPVGIRLGAQRFGSASQPRTRRQPATAGRSSRRTGETATAQSRPGAAGATPPAAADPRCRRQPAHRGRRAEGQQMRAPVSAERRRRSKPAQRGPSWSRPLSA
jgi:hypothetical protein